jgi:hypothetical protein
MSMAFEGLIQDVLVMGDFVRYVAIGEGQRITTADRDGLENASTPDSDRFEELFVNPALVTLARQRGSSIVEDSATSSSRTAPSSNS